MAISISTKPKLQTHKDAAAQKRQQKKAVFFQQRAELENQFKDIEDQKHIADSIEAGRMLGKLSAQEIIEAHEEYHGKILGERQRKYIVASLIAKHGLTFGKAHGANNYNDDVFNYILERMMEGESLRHICEDPYMPAKSVFFMWLSKDDGLNDRYTRAREIRKEVMEDEIQYHSENPFLTPVITINADGTQTIQIVDNIQRSKLITDSLKWRLSKMDPARFGNTVAEAGVSADGNKKVEVVGGLPSNPLGSSPVFIDDPEHPNNQLPAPQATIEKPSQAQGYDQPLSNTTVASSGSSAFSGSPSVSSTSSSPEIAADFVGAADLVAGSLPDLPLGDVQDV